MENRLKELRQERKLSLRNMANIINIDHTTISSYENCTRDLSTKTSKKLAEFFEVTIDYLLDYSNSYLYVRYENTSSVFKITHSLYLNLNQRGVIYINSTNNRCINLNKLFNLDSSINLLELIQEANIINKINVLFENTIISENNIKEALKKDEQLVLTEHLLNLIDIMLK